MLVDGKWNADWHPVQAQDGKGRFIRQTSGFRNWITPDGAPGPTGMGGFRAEKGRYHLYVALICPWASRVLIARKLKGLEGLISLSVVEPFLTDQGWHFGDYPGAGNDPLFSAQYLHEIYTRSDPAYSGRATVPVLWDKQTNRMMNNESADILRMLNTAFADLAPESVDLCPPDLAAEIDRLNPWIYETLNNGVYKAGFASSQQAYEEAVGAVFETLDTLEERFSDGRSFILGARLSETDIRLFVTLIRFDAAYHGLFKTNLRRVQDYPCLQRYLVRMLAVPGIADTVNLDHIKTGYYSIKALNPTGIVPAGPQSVEELIAEARK
jgi:glutathionyl-hydroquinone reductase